MAPVAALSLVTSALAVANSVTANIMEQSTEIGLMKAVGAKNRLIIALPFTETTIVGLFGGGLGYAAGLGLARIIGHMIFASPIAFTLIAFALVILLVLLIILGAPIPTTHYLLQLNAAEVLYGR